MNALLKKYWPEILVVIGIIMEFAIKRLTEIEQANEHTTVVGLLLAVLVALYSRHYGSKPDSTNPVVPQQQSRFGGSR